jgi:hypothetical protein
MSRSSVIFIIVIVVIIGAGYALFWRQGSDGGGDELIDQEQSALPTPPAGTQEPAPTGLKPAPTGLKPAPTGLKTYSDTAYNYSFRYDENQFSQANNVASQDLYINGKFQGGYTAPVKLIHPGASAKLGAVACYYGESGIAQPCTAERERGMAFVPVNASAASLLPAKPDPLITNVIISGTSVPRYRAGAGGYVTSIYYISLNPSQSLLIRTDAEAGFPSDALIQQVLESVRKG